MRFGVRFWPPNAPLDLGVHWALLRAFGPPDICAPVIQNPSHVASVAQQLGLMTRIFARCDRATLQSELGPAYVEHTRQVQLAAARGLALERCLRTVDSLAEQLQVPYALIKGAALARTGVAPLGHRNACDLDILLSEANAGRLHAALKDRGFQEKTPTHPGFHFPMLLDDAGGAVEIHTRLPHVRMIPGGPEVTLQQLLDAHRVSQAPELSEYAHVPVPDLLLAHAIAHGIAQHGYAPQSYQLLRTLADAIDLEIVSNPTRATQALWWVQPDVTYHEVTALREVAKLLRSGNAVAAWGDTGRNGRMLRHLILGSLDLQYARGLKLHGAIDELRTMGAAEFMATYGRTTFALDKADIPRIYGTAARGRELRYKLLRPFDMARRVVSALVPAAIIASRQVKALARLIIDPRLG